MLPTVYVNYWAVLVAAIASMVVGMLWYSPKVFGSMWMELMGFTMKDMEKAKQKGMGMMYFTAFIGAFVTSYVLDLFIKYLQASTIADGLQVGFWLWLGFIATVGLGSVLWEGKHPKVYLINMAHQLVSILIMNLILTAWV